MSSVRPAFGTALLGVLMLVVGSVFDTGVLYVAGATFAALGAATLLAVGLGSRGARMTRRPDTDRVEEESPLAVHLHATAGRFPLVPATVEEPLLASPLPMRLAERELRARVEVTFSRRGRRVLAPARLVIGDPLGLARRVAVSAGTDEVLVLPRVHPVELSPVGASGGDSATARSAALGVAETEMDGLRPLREGTPASRIHWASAAKGAEPMELNLVSEADRRPVVLLDARRPDDPDALDRAVRATASLVHRLAIRGGCGVMLPGDRRVTTVAPDLHAWPDVHFRLALVEAGAAPSYAGARERRGLVIVVSARSVDRPPAGLTRAEGGLLLVVPSPTAGRTPVLQVAGCTAYAVGRSSDRQARAVVGSA